MWKSALLCQTLVGGGSGKLADVCAARKIKVCMRETRDCHWLPESRSYSVSFRVFQHNEAIEILHKSCKARWLNRRIRYLNRIEAQAEYTTLSGPQSGSGALFKLSHRRFGSQVGNPSHGVGRDLTDL